MTLALEIVVRDLDGIAGLREELAVWGGTTYSRDPESYGFKTLRFSRVPVARHVRAALPPSLADVEACLSLSEECVLALAHGRSLDLCQELGEFARAASGMGLPWAAVVDPGVGTVSVRLVGPPRERNATGARSPRAAHRVRACVRCQTRCRRGLALPRSTLAISTRLSRDSSTHDAGAC